MNVDHYRIANEQLDKRTKLTEDDRATIRVLHSVQHMAIRAIARQFNVDKRLIQFILFPERYQLNKDLRRTRGGSKIYYDKEHARIAIAKHRKYKRELAAKGLLIKKGVTD